MDNLTNCINKPSPSPDHEVGFTARPNFSSLVQKFIQEVGNSLRPIQQENANQSLKDPEGSPAQIGGREGRQQPHKEASPNTTHINIAQPEHDNISEERDWNMHTNLRESQNTMSITPQHDSPTNGHRATNEIRKHTPDIKVTSNTSDAQEVASVQTHPPQPNPQSKGKCPVPGRRNRPNTP